jgi:hypothetical protein
VPLLSWRRGDHLVVSTVRPDPQRFANLEADPNDRVQLHRNFRDATAPLARGALNLAILDVV